MAITIDSEWLLTEGLHPFATQLGVPSKFYFSMSESEWIPIEKMDLHHAISARNFLIDVIINCQHMIWANSQLRENNLKGYEETVLKGVMNIQLGLTNHINTARRKRGERYFKEYPGKGYEVKWHYHHHPLKEGEKLTPEQEKAYKRGMATIFCVEEAIRVTKSLSTNEKESKRRKSAVGSRPNKSVG